MVEEKEVIEKITQVEDNEEYPHPNSRNHQFVLLLRVTQDDGQPLPVKEFMSRAMVQMICNVTGVVPKEVEILLDQEVVVEVEDQSSVMEVSRRIQGLFHWEGQAITVDSIVAVQDLISGIVKEWQIHREKQQRPEQEQWQLRENQQVCQQQMIDILEKVSEQVKRVENI